jgi:hypothetical protein
MSETPEPPEPCPDCQQTPCVCAEIAATFRKDAERAAKIFNGRPTLSEVLRQLESGYTKPNGGES